MKPKQDFYKFRQSSIYCTSGYSICHKICNCNYYKCYGRILRNDLLTITWLQNVCSVLFAFRKLGLYHMDFKTC
jgi:hypothetical protein